METLHFKTNIKTSDDVAAVTLPLNDIDRIADATGGWLERKYRSPESSIDRTNYR